MSVIDTIKEAVGVTPTYTSEEREKVRAEARASAMAGSWFSMILDHHVQLEQAFAAVKAASGEAGRKSAQMELAVLLTGHANAEESVIYPGMQIVGESGAAHAYKEQAEAKTQMAMLDDLPSKTSQAYLDKLEEIRLAVQHHMIEEEGTWFPELAKMATPEQNRKFTRLYTEEFNRYTGERKAV